ncbi:bifunctional DNA repair-transcription protein MET18-MMS19/MMS19 [Babesia duncani]|uniref:MMS19 nucleotide excision repair protein n=1 Tax=Babesia duncani TaxID=323732 RepID=A0AAD9PL58_9APIC|nr:bifunctional DNA repair-transcription protein MET18-MMS19/MMS19 [Babesia duncani]
MEDAGDDVFGGEYDEISNLVNSYTSSDDEYSLNDHRNSLLIALLKGNAEVLVKVVNHLYLKTSNPVLKRNICKLTFELISRTQDIFNGSILGFLTSSVKATICMHHSILGIKALFQRHIKFNDALIQQYLKEIKTAFETLLTLDISSLGQSSRFDFLWISHYIFEIGTLDLAVDFPKVFKLLQGEKDPRNLLLMFDLCIKYCRAPNAKLDLNSVTNLFVAYFPIYFTPPKNDKIGIQPSQLKQRLLECFVAHEGLGKYTLEVLIDALYSGYVNQEEHCAVLANVLEFLVACSSCYSKGSFAPFLDSLCDAILNEVFSIASDAPNPLGVEGVNSQILEIEWIQPHPKQPLDPKMSDSTDNSGIVDTKVVKAINALGKEHRHAWENVPQRLELYYEITRVFLSTIDDISGLNLKEFTRLLNHLSTLISMGDAESNMDGEAGYILDAICTIPQCHPYVMMHAIAPICNRMVHEFLLSKKNGNAYNPQASLDILVNVLGSLCINFQGYRFQDDCIIQAGACCIESGNEEILKNGLKLLVLGSVVTTSTLANTVLEYLANQSQLLNTGPKGERELLHMESLLDIYTCKGIGHVIETKVKAHSIQMLQSNDISSDIQTYFSSSRACTIYAKLVVTLVERGMFVNELLGMTCACIQACIQDGFKSRGLLAIVNIISNIVFDAKLDKIDREAIARFSCDLDQYSNLWHQGNIQSKSGLLLLVKIVPHLLSHTLDFDDDNLLLKLMDLDLTFLLPIFLPHLGLDKLLNLFEPLVKYCQYIQDRGIESDVILLNFECGCLALSEIVRMHPHKKDILPVMDKLQSNIKYSIAQGFYDTPFYVGILQDTSVPTWHILHFISQALPFDNPRLQDNLRTLGFDARNFTIDNRYCDHYFSTVPKPLNMSSKIVKYQWLHALSFQHPFQYSDESLDHLTSIVTKQMSDGSIAKESCPDKSLVLVELLLSTDHVNASSKIIHLLKVWQSMDKHSWACMQPFGKVKEGESYEKWCQESFVIKLHALLLRVLVSVLGRGTSKRRDFEFTLEPQSIPNGVPVHAAFDNIVQMLQNEEFINDTAKIALDCCVVNAKILALLVLHATFKTWPTADAQLLASTIKQISPLLGDGCKRVRLVALKCREHWLACLKGGN